MRVLGVAALVACVSVPAFAGGVTCHVPKDKWRPVDELKSALTAKGWSIKNVKTTNGCYEVYGKDETGKRAEIFFDPQSFQALGSDD